MTRTTPSETSDQDANSRRARLVARRSRRTRLIVGLIVVLIAGAIGVGAYALNANGTDAHAAGTTNAPRAGDFGKQGTLVSPAVNKTPAPRALSHADPLKLWVGGDSLAGSFGPALGDQVGATGIVKTVIDYKVSSGLWSNDIRNWYQRATEQMALQNPDAILFIIGTNDTPVVNKVDANNDGIADWQAEYQLKVARMMDLLVGPKHRTVFWLGPPTLSTKSMDAGAKEMGEVMRAEAAKRAPDVTYLDTYKLFSTPDGTFSRRILDETGKEITARISDGVHFTEDGAQYLARAVFSLIDARWKLIQQADPTSPIGWSLADGSGESVPGFHSAPRSRYRPQSGSGSGSGNSNTPTTSGSVSQTTTPQSTTPVTASPTTVSQSTVPQTSPHTTPTTPASTVPHTTTSKPAAATSP